MTTWDDVRKAVIQASVDIEPLSEVEQLVEKVKQACVVAAMNKKLKIEPIAIPDKKLCQAVFRILAADGWPVKEINLSINGSSSLSCNLPNVSDEKTRSAVFDVPHQPESCYNMMDFYFAVNRWLSKNLFRVVGSENVYQDFQGTTITNFWKKSLPEDSGFAEMTCCLREIESKAHPQAPPPTQRSTLLVLELRVDHHKRSKYLRLSIAQEDSMINVFKFYPGGLFDPMMSSLDNALTWMETSLSL